MDAPVGVPSTDRLSSKTIVAETLRPSLALLTLRSADEEWAELARNAPGFAGVTVDDTGLPVIAVKRGADRISVAATVKTYLQARIGTREEAALLSSIGVIDVESDFDELYRASELVRPLYTDAAVTMLDIDEAANRVVIGVASPGDVAPMEMRLAALGSPGNLVRVVVSPAVQVASTVQSLIRPVLAGTQIGIPGGVCTMGPSVLPRVAGVIDASVKFFLTNSHCTPQFGSIDGIAIGQPLVGNPVGVDVYDPPLFTNVQNHNCDVGRLCRWSDATLVALNPGINHTFGQIARTVSPTNLTRKSNYIILGESPYYVPGLSILYKTGRTTGTSFGQSFQTCVKVKQFESGLDTGRDMLCQDQVSLLSQGGDSGSPVFSSLNTETTNVTLHGMLWGTGWTEYPNGGLVKATFSRINYIYAELNPYFPNGFLTALP